MVVPFLLVAYPGGAALKNKKCSMLNVQVHLGIEH